MKSRARLADLMELASLELSAAESLNEPLARFAIAAPLVEEPGEAVFRLVQTRWRDGASRERETCVRGESEMQALCLAIRLMVTEIETLAEKYGPLVTPDGRPFDPKTFGLAPIQG